MDYSKKQQQLDVKKWVDSEIKGYDTCGEYNYCASCNKSESYPCACAYETYSAISKLAKATTTTAKKTTTKKATSSKSTASKSTTAAKKTTCKRTTTKKATVTAC